MVVNTVSFITHYPTESLTNFTFSHLLHGHTNNVTSQLTTILFSITTAALEETAANDHSSGENVTLEYLPLLLVTS